MDFNALFSQLAGPDEKSPINFQELFEQITEGKSTDQDNPMSGLMSKLQYLQAMQRVNVEPDQEADELIDALNGECIGTEADEFIDSLNAEV